MMQQLTTVKRIVDRTSNMSTCVSCNCNLCCVSDAPVGAAWGAAQLSSDFPCGTGSENAPMRWEISLAGWRFRRAHTAFGKSCRSEALSADQKARRITRQLMNALLGMHQWPLNPSCAIYGTLSRTPRCHRRQSTTFSDRVKLIGTRCMVKIIFTARGTPLSRHFRNGTRQRRMFDGRLWTCVRLCCCTALF